MRCASAASNTSRCAAWTSTPSSRSASRPRRLHFLDIFLLHCLLSDSPPDTPRKSPRWRATSTRPRHGREPGLRLERGAGEISLLDWAGEVLDECEPIALALDAAEGGEGHQDSLRLARTQLARPEQLPSARVLAEMTQHHGGDHVAFVDARSEITRETLSALPLPAEATAAFEAWPQRSIDDQRHIEAMDSLPFEIYRQEYLAPRRLGAALSPPH